MANPNGLENRKQNMEDREINIRVLVFATYAFSERHCSCDIYIYRQIICYTFMDIEWTLSLRLLAVWFEEE